MAQTMDGPDTRRRPLRRRLAPAALLVAAMAAAPTTAAAPPEIVLRSIAHHGGDLYTGAEIALTLCSRSGCYRIASRLDGGLYEHSVSGPIRAGERWVRMTNDTVEARLDGEPVEIAPGEESALRDWAMQRIYFPFLPYRLADPSVVHRDLGLESWDGRTLHKVAVGFEAGSSTDASDEYLHWFDPETGRLEQFAYSYAGDPGGLRFRRLGNYRRIGGILFHDQENLGVEGEGLEVGQITPQLVRDRMRPVSEVTVREISVRPLDPPPPPGR